MNFNTFFKLSYGLYIVSSTDGTNFTGHISNTVFQTTSEPPTLAICVNKSNLTSEYIDKSGVLSISIINQDADFKFIGHFGFKSGKDINKFENIDFTVGKTNVPIVIENVIGYLECKVVNKMDLGTHKMFIAEIIEAEMVAEGEPLTYEYYRKVKKGLSPKTAPTYIDKSKLKTN